MLLVLAFVLMVLGISAQTGLLGLYYGESFSVARSALQNKGFVMIKNGSVAKEFTLEFPTTYYLVTLYINPDTSRMVGWSIRYKENLTEDAYEAIYSECLSLHGEDYYVKEESRFIGWKLDETKTFMLGFDENRELNIAVYSDDNFTNIFEREGEKP